MARRPKKRIGSASPHFSAAMETARVIINSFDPHEPVPNTGDAQFAEVPTALLNNTAYYARFSLVGSEAWFRLPVGERRLSVIAMAVAYDGIGPLCVSGLRENVTLEEILREADITMAQYKELIAINPEPLDETVYNTGLPGKLTFVCAFQQNPDC